MAHPRPLRSLFALLLLASAPSAQTLIARVNAGGPAFTDVLGRSWSADAPYSPGGGGFEGGSSLGVLSGLDGRLVGPEDNPTRKAFATARVAWTAYRFDVPDGDYVVRLSLAEIWNQGPGLRSMSVAVEGAPLLADVDLAAVLGVQYGGQVAAFVHVSDGRLDVEAAPGPGVDPPVDAPIVCGVEVWSAPAAPLALPRARDLAAQASFGANLLAWAWETEPAVAGWRVWRAEEGPGPQHAVASPPAASWVPIADVWAMPPRFHDRSAVPGRRYRYRVAALGLDGSIGPRSVSVAAAAMDGATTVLPRYELALDPADQLFIDANILLQPDIEVPATFTFAGGARAAETRYRGNTSRTHPKKSWKVKFSAADAFQGRRELNLKAHNLDAGLMRDELAHRLFAAVGQTGFEVRPVHLEVNGRYLGVFNEAEEMDEAFLAARDRDTGGDIFEANSNLTTLPTLAQYELLYEKKTNESTGHAALIAFVDLLNAPPSPTFLQELADVFDVDAFLSYLAVIEWIGDRDSIVHNYFLHQDLSLDRWEVWPWDNDVSFALLPSMLHLSILLGTSAVPGEPVNQLRERVLAEPGLLWRYCRKMAELEEGFANPTWLNGQVLQAAAARRRDAHADPFKLGWESAVPFESDALSLLTYAALRNPIVDQELALVQPATPPTVIWVNELAAEAQALVQDEAGEFEDWVELYNASAAPADLGGLYLTDDLSAPTRWQIPGGTTIPTGGHLVVWCDAEPLDGPLHAPFDLEAAGGELGLFDAAGTALLDFAAWNRQYPDLAWGRFRDAGQYFQLLPAPTPGAANTLAGNLPPALTWVGATPPVPGSGEPVEVTCRATDADGLGAVELHWRANGGAFATVAMSALGADRYGATLAPHPDGTLVEYYLTATDALSATATKPVEGALAPFHYMVVDSALDFLTVNEIVASNATGAQDEAGEFEDWIELHNASSGAFDLSGMFLSDDLANTTKWEIPAGTAIPADGYLHVWADDEPADGPLHATFKLSAGGEDVGLFDTLANGNGLIDGYSYGAQTSDVAFGRLPDGTASGYLLSTPSPGASNPPAPGSSRVYEHADSAANPVVLFPAGSPVLGGTIGAALSSAPPSRSGVFVLGLVPADAAVPGSGYALVAQPVAAWTGFTTTAAGTASVSFAVPADPGLIGYRVYTQALVSSAGFSNGAVGTIGP